MANNLERCGKNETKIAVLNNELVNMKSDIGGTRVYINVLREKILPDQNKQMVYILNTAEEAVKKAKSANDNIRTLFITVIGAMFLVLITSIINQYSPVGGVAKLNKSIHSSINSLETTLKEIVKEKNK